MATFSRSKRLVHAYSNRTAQYSYAGVGPAFCKPTRFRVRWLAAWQQSRDPGYNPTDLQVILNGKCIPSSVMLIVVETEDAKPVARGK